MEYQTLMDVHDAETRAAAHSARGETKRASELSGHAMDSAPDAWDLYQRVRMGD